MLKCHNRPVRQTHAKHANISNDERRIGLADVKWHDRTVRQTQSTTLTSCLGTVKMKRVHKKLTRGLGSMLAADPVPSCNELLSLRKPARRRRCSLHAQHLLLHLAMPVGIAVLSMYRRM